MTMKKSKQCCATYDVGRCQIIKSLAAGVSLASTSLNLPVKAGSFFSGPVAKDVKYTIPVDKKLTANWLASLYQRGQAARYSHWQEQRYIGMPVGGIGSGTVYIGGDGKLWCWDIFNQHHEGVVPATTPDGEYTSPDGTRLREHNGANFVYPPEQQSPWNFEQGFAVQLKAPAAARNKAPAAARNKEPAAARNNKKTDAKFERRTLDRQGFKDIQFEGQPPIARVSYADPDTPLKVQLEAMTPYIPLDEERSGYPATILRYTLTNSGSETLWASLEGWSENPALAQHSHRNDSGLINKTIAFEQGVGVALGCDTTNPVPPGYPAIDTLPDYGSLALLCLDADAQATAASFLAPRDKRLLKQEYRSHSWSPAIAGISRDLELASGQSKTITFVLAWHFPNVRLQTQAWSKEKTTFAQARARRWYAAQFADASAVALDLAKNIEELVRLTRLWRDQWYDSTLPHWLLERSIITANALQTNTCYRFDDGRFWAWEGVGCCPGTCTHVWHYAQSVGRLFPALERDLRERTDYGISFQPDGAIYFRGEYNDRDATDGQAGVILRTYREHQMSGDNAFLLRVWPRAKKALEFLISQDARDGVPDGIPVGEQHNTLDAEWFGKIPALASLYLAALRAGEEMARATGDLAFAARCHQIHARGEKNIVKLFDEARGFFVQEEDPAHSEAIGIGTGCHIDQVIGQWWAHQLGLGSLYDRATIRRALSSLWDYNFCPDVGQLRDSIDNPKLRGRPYALAGDAGLLICTWPKGGKKDDWEQHWQFGYFNECMTGFEYQVASHMIWESSEQADLLEKGLAITRAIHDRYHGALRNPYNEIECSDHYARAMSSYSVFLALCGFEYDASKGHIGFKPRLTNDQQFKAAFTAAKGWGSFAQRIKAGQMDGAISLSYGQLELNTMALRLPGVSQKGRIILSKGQAHAEWQGQDVTLVFDKPVTLTAAETLTIQIM